MQPCEGCEHWCGAEATPSHGVPAPQGLSENNPSQRLSGWLCALVGTKANAASIHTSKLWKLLRLHRHASYSFPIMAERCRGRDHKPSSDREGLLSIIPTCSTWVGIYGLARNPKRCKVGWMPLHSAGRGRILTPTRASARKVSCARCPGPPPPPYNLDEGGGAPARGTHT